jgi:hypothetical protein
MGTAPCFRESSKTTPESGDVDADKAKQEADEKFEMKQKEAFAKHGFKDDVELKIGVDLFEFKFKYDPTKQIKLKYKGEELILTKELIENINFYGIT